MEEKDFKNYILFKKGKNKSEFIVIDYLDRSISKRLEKELGVSINYNTGFPFVFVYTTTIEISNDKVDDMIKILDDVRDNVDSKDKSSYEKYCKLLYERVKTCSIQ